MSRQIPPFKYEKPRVIVKAITLHYVVEGDGVYLFWLHDNMGDSDSNLISITGSQLEHYRKFAAWFGFDVFEHEHVSFSIVDDGKNVNLC